MRKARMCGAFGLLTWILAGSTGCIDAVREGTTAGISAATESIITMVIEDLLDRGSEAQ